MARSSPATTREELAAAKNLLEEDKERARRAKSKLARKNAKRAAKLVKRTIASIQEHQDLLTQGKSTKPCSKTS
jgi:hypothetical protein